MANTCFLFQVILAGNTCARYTEGGGVFKCFDDTTHAAERLRTSRPTLSKRLKELEGELGKRLFIRGNYNVRLTDEGVLLRKRAEDILDMVGKTEEEFKTLGEITGGDVRISCMTGSIRT